jgi:hypothetical protein
MLIFLVFAILLVPPLVAIVITMHDMRKYRAQQKSDFWRSGPTDGSAAT